MLACELSIKKSIKKNDNAGEVYKLRNTFAVFHHIPLCFVFFWKRSLLVH